MESNETNRQAGEDQLRIEERKASLGLEKSLSSYHRALVVYRDAAEASGAQEVSEALNAAVWHLGHAILQVVKLRNGS